MVATKGSKENPTGREGSETPGMGKNGSKGKSSDVHAGSEINNGYDTGYTDKGNKGT